MRVFSGQQRTWLAGLLVVLCLGPGSAAPARAAGEAIELAFDSPLTIELSKQDSVDLVLPPGTGYAVLEVQSHLLAIELQVPESSGTAVLRSLTEAPTTWLFEQRDAPVERCPSCQRAVIAGRRLMRCEGNDGRPCPNCGSEIPGFEAFPPGSPTRNG